MNPKEAKKILPKKEYETFEPILMNQISRTSAAKLKQRATLARRLRDKYKDLAHHLAAGVRTRRTNETDTDINDRRARLFQDIIDKLEESLEQPRAPRASTAVKKKAARIVRARAQEEDKDKASIRAARMRTRKTVIDTDD